MATEFQRPEDIQIRASISSFLLYNKLKDRLPRDAKKYDPTDIVRAAFEPIIHLVQGDGKAETSGRSVEHMRGMKVIEILRKIIPADYYTSRPSSTERQLDEVLVASGRYIDFLSTRPQLAPEYANANGGASRLSSNLKRGGG